MSRSAPWSLLPSSLFLGAVLCATARGQTLIGTLPGQAGERFGTAAVLWYDVDLDGFPELLVTAPAYSNPNGGSGAVMVVSGRFLALGAGAPVLYVVPGLASTGVGALGRALALVGDWTGDGIDEVVVMATYGVGVIDMVTSQAMGWIVNDLGGVLDTLAVISDYTFDGRPEVAVGVPGYGDVYVLKSQGFLSTSYFSQQSLASVSGSSGFGQSLAVRPGALPEQLLIGDYHYGPGFHGAVQLWTIFSTQTSVLIEGEMAGEGLGYSLDVLDDLDGDGLGEVLVGAPFWGPAGKQEGRALVVSGADGVVLREYQGGVSGPNLNATGYQLGFTVRASPDLNADGVGDYMIGLPAYATQLPIGPAKGGARVYSGATGDQFVGVTGANNDMLGELLLGVHDYDGDGFPELLVGGPRSDAGGTDSGRINLYRLYPVPPRTYCSGKPNTQGCTPAVSWSGSASASAATPFTAGCSNLLNNKLGVLFYGLAPSSNPFGGGTKCVQNPVKRLPAQDSGGSPTGDDCTGTYAYELNALIQSGANPALVAGRELYCQFWSRDPLASFGSSLSNGLRLVINP